MKWVYVTEDYTTADFLRGGELVITTGVVSGGSSDWLMRFLERMIRRNTSGLILNLGAYLDRGILTEQVLSYCETHRYPLFVMPWHIHLYDVTRVFYEQIYLHTRRDEELRAAFSTLLSQDAGVKADPHLQEGGAASAQGSSKSAAAAVLEEAGFPAQGSYCTALFHTPDPARLSGILSEMLARHPAQGYVMTHLRDCCLILRAQSTEEMKQFLALAAEQIPDTRAGIGDCVEGAAQIGRSFRHAKCALSLGEQQERTMTVYDETGIFQLLMDVQDTGDLRRYSEKMLSAVHAYDRAHNSDLAGTLYLYVLHNGSVRDVAGAAFCHRNTVNHRIRILREDLGIDLDSPGRRLELLAAFRSETYLEALQR